MKACINYALESSHEIFDDPEASNFALGLVTLPKPLSGDKPHPMVIEMGFNCDAGGSLHELHVSIGDLIEDSLGERAQLVRDQACGGNQQIPLFCSEEKSNKTKYCNVDLLVIQDGKVRVIVEIEESDVKPTHVCGKFLTSALARYYIHETEENPIGMHDSVTFIQVVDTSDLKAMSMKPYQWKNLESSIGNILPIRDSNIKEYRLFTDLELNELVDYVRGRS